MKGWILERAPGAPQDVVQDVTNQFLDDLQTNHPSQFDQLLDPAFPAKDYESTLLRDMAAHLKGPSWTSLKEQLALRRIQSVLSSDSEHPDARVADAGGILARIKADPDAIYYQRLIDGKIEDDDLSTQVRKHLPGADQPKSVVAAQPTVLTVGDIVAEFARRNQEGSSIEKLRAYVIDATVDSPVTGSHQVMLFKLRPDFVRMVFLKDGLTQSIVAGHGDIYWSQSPGHEPAAVPVASIADLRHLAEFIDPFFVDEGYKFERLADGVDGKAPYYRVGVQRGDGSGFVARVDQATFHEIGRENRNGTVDVVSDFRTVAGLTVGFRVETTDAKGQRSTFQISRFTPNTGVVQALFEAPEARDRGYFEIERLIAKSEKDGSGTAQ